MSTKISHLHKPMIKVEPTDFPPNDYIKKEQQLSSNLRDTTNLIREQIMLLTKKTGNYTRNQLSSCGFEDIGDAGGTIKCKDCGLELSSLIKDIDLKTFHAKESPDCPFVRTKILCSQSNLPSSVISSSTTIRNTSLPIEQNNPAKRQKIETNDLENSSLNLIETNLLQQVRRRTFSHWPHRTIPSTAQMIEAGFLNCNVGDRVICIYCNLICQQWTPHTDDPCEVHKTLSPNCTYVKAKLVRPAASSIVIVNEHSANNTSSNQTLTSNNLDPLRSNEIVHTAACNPAYAEIPKRHASFATWVGENLPPVDDLVRAGFFYTGTKSIVTCFYCNGSLQNWGKNDNPMIEHARWFPHCAYAKQLCGDELYRKIQESKRAQQERARANEAAEKGTSAVITSSTTPKQKLQIPDESTLSRLVAARLDLPISQRLLDQHFKLSIIKRCWEDQLRLKHDDFVSDCDLYMACLILQKQIEHIDGKKENIVIPSIKMKQIREQNARAREQLTSAPTIIQLISNPTDVEMTGSQSSTNDSTSSQSSVESSSKPIITTNQSETNANKTTTTSSTKDQDQSDNTTASNPCVLCLTEEKRLACIPCGHLATCVPCGHSLRSCPICRREIEAFVRVYI